MSIAVETIIKTYFEIGLATENREAVYNICMLYNRETAINLESFISEITKG